MDFKKSEILFIIVKMNGSMRNLFEDIRKFTFLEQFLLNNF